MRVPSPAAPPPLRLAAPAALALAALLAVAGRAGDVEAGPGRAWPLWGAPADTDSVAVPLPGALAADTVEAEADSLAADSLAVAADTVASDSLARAYFRQPVRTGPGVALAPRRLPGVRGRLGTYWRREVTLDSAAYRYRVREVVGEDDVRAPADLTLAEFLAARRQAALGEQFRTLAAQRGDQRTRRSGLGFDVDIPGGENSAFRTLFGKNEVALTVNGTSNLELGTSYDQNDLQEARSGRGGSIVPTFGQDLNLNVAGTIGDKLQVNVNYDTNSQFDFENQVSLVYTGYEDDIVQRIEAGNVFLETPATLIRGGQRLFGLSTDLQLGPLALKAVASQQDGETVDRVFEGGAEAQAFRLAPYEYEDDTHFFLGYAFHNWWDAGHERPGIATPPPGPLGQPGMNQIIGIEVYKYERGIIDAPVDDAETTWAIALADLGEPEAVLAGGEAYLGAFDPVTGRYANAQAPLPNADPDIDRYSDGQLQDYRQNGQALTAGEVFPGADSLAAGAFENTRFRLLRETIDYTFDPFYGWLSLTTALTEGDALAVAYQYRTTAGTIVTVGDYQTAVTTSQNRGRRILKLLRADRPTPNNPLWDLTMRNVYRVGGRSLNPATFEMDVTFEPSGATAAPVPRDVSFGGQATFLQVLGLDRLTAQGSARPDNAFDFDEPLTVDAENGRVIFPVRQPFGDYFQNLLRSGWTVGERIDVDLGGLSEDQALGRYVPTVTGSDDDLYDLDRDVARTRLPGLTRFRLAGEFRSATQSIFNVGFSLIEGTVRVTSGGQELAENADYRVNYTAGTVEITNPVYLQDGKEVRVSVEQNQIFEIGSKTLLGLRADYRLAENTRLGATWMRLSERPLGDKFRVGEEALNNSVVGLDASYLAEPRWITRAIDALPLFQTRAPSRVEIRGEVARLSPGHPTTLGFDRARDALRAADLDFGEDELSGVSYIDDFEGSENAYTALGLATGWQLAAAPRDEAAGPPGAFVGSASSDVTDPFLKTNWRGLFGWYAITRTAYERFEDVGLLTRATEEITNGELFPDRDQDPQTRQAPVGLLDLYFDPSQRGPYNYNEALQTAFAQNPRDAWGGMVQPISAAYSDFGGQNNVEYVEILMAPFGGRDGTEPVTPGAVLYLDLGRIGEDVLPNGGERNGEDGLRDGGLPDIDGDGTPDCDDEPSGECDAWGRRPTSQVTNGVVDFFEETGRTEDLGLDGLPSRPGLSLGEEYESNERVKFADFVDALTPGSLERVRAENDPSGDDYHYFLEGVGDTEGSYFDDPTFFPASEYPNGASVQERHAHYLAGVEFNSAVAQRQLQSVIGGSGQGIAVLPDAEDVNGDGKPDVAEAFHRYRIPLDADSLRASPFFQNTIPVPSEFGPAQTWYLLRIPVRTSARETLGGLDRDDFSQIEAVRVWTTGHDRPATVRIASFDLVGSQWLQSRQVGFTGEDLAAGGPDPDLFVEAINNEENAPIYAVPKGTILNTSRSQSGQIQRTREAALVFRAENLPDGRRAAVVRSYTTRPLDLTKYDNLRMAVHGHGFDRSDSVRVFLRLGDNETEDYYEIEQPVYPFSPDRLDALGLGPCADPVRPFNCARSDSLWQTNVQVGGERRDLNPINLVLAELNQAKLLRDQAGADPALPYELPRAPEGAPEGAVVRVVGQPSVQDVKIVVLGVRNGRGGDPAPLDTVEVWFNELRVTGYDEAGGTSGFLTTNVALADVATVNARLSFTDDGFGELGGALGGRDFASRTVFTLTSSFNAHKLLPERFGWSVPVNVSVEQNASTPRFDPDRGDVRVSELVEAATTGSQSGQPGALRPEDVLERAQTVRSARTLRVAVSKTGSRSPWLKYTLDGVRATFSASSQSGANPSNRLTASDSWSGNVSYRLTPPKPVTVRPFWFTGGLPVLGGLRINVLPQNVALSADAGRRTSASQARLAPEFLFGPDGLPEADSVRDFRALTRRTHAFDHGRQLDLRYVPLPFLQLGYASTTDQDFGAAGQLETTRVLVRDTVGLGFARTYPLTAAEARNDAAVREALAAAGLQDPDGGFPDGVEVLGGPRLEVLPLGEALGNVFAGGGRTRAYGQRLTSSLRISTGRLKWLRWIQPQPISYSADYNWRDQPVPSADTLEVASAGTSAQVQSSLRVVPREFWRLFPFYRKLEEARDAPADSARGFSPFRLARGLFLGLTGVEDVTVSYRGSLTSATGGLRGQDYSLLSGLQGSAPPLAYRLGLERRLDISRRLANRDAYTTFNDLLGERHDFDARTSLRPFGGLTVGLTWRAGWQEAETTPFSITEGNELVEEFSTRRGDGSSTVWSFGGTYDAVVQRHADRYRADVAEPGPDGVVRTEFISPTGLADDFSAVLARGLGSFGPGGFVRVPLPNWQVTYSGLERLPLVRALAQQVTLQHGYSSEMQTGYATITREAGARLDPLGTDLSLVGAADLAGQGFDEPTDVNVTERFQPLLGMTVGWKGGLQTTVTYNRSEILQLQPSQAQVVEKGVGDVRVDVSWAKTGLRLLGLRRLNNNLRFTLTGVVASEATTTHPLRDDVIALLDPDVERPIPAERSQQRLQLSPRISYTISNQVTADVFVRYERLLTEGTSAFPSRSFDGGVNLRILFSN